MVDIEDYKATLDSTKKHCFETLEQRWFHIERCYNLLDMHLDPTIRTTPSLIEDEARLFSHLDQISGARRSRGINVNVPFVEPSKIRLNAFKKSELKIFASFVELDVQFIWRPVGVHFETKEATCLRLETMRNHYKAKHKSNMKREAKVKKLAKQKAKQEAKQRVKEKVEEEKRPKEIARKNAKQRTKVKSEEERKVKQFFKQYAMLSFKEKQEMKNKGFLQKRRERDATKKRRRRARGLGEEDQVDEDLPHNQIQHIPQACQKVQFYNLEYIHQT
jgi:hypothetical protein